MSNPEEPQDENAPPLQRTAGRRFAGLIDQLVNEAEQAGLFKDLPGTGKPLELDDDSLVPNEERTAFRMLKNAGFAPPWIELQKEIRSRQEQLNNWVERVNRRWPQIGPLEQAQILAEHEHKIQELNKLITSYNLSAPPVAGQLPLLQLWRERARLGI